MKRRADVSTANPPKRIRTKQSSANGNVVVSFKEKDKVERGKSPLIERQGTKNLKNYPAKYLFHY